MTLPVSSWPSGARTRLPVERAMGPVAIVVVLPLPQLLVEQLNVVGDPVFVQELVELLVIDAVRAFHLAVQMRCPRPDVGVADIQVRQVPVEARLKLRAVVPSVWMTSTRNGRRRNTSSIKRVAVPWLQAS